MFVAVSYGVLEMFSTLHETAKFSMTSDLEDKMQLVDISLAAFTWATQLRDTQLPAVSRPLHLAELFRQDTKWLGDSHCGRAMALHGRDTSLWLGHWSNAQSYKSIQICHSSCHCETESQLASLESAGMEEDKCLRCQSCACPAKPLHACG
jgi:hypothetical protein